MHAVAATGSQRRIFMGDTDAAGTKFEQFPAAFAAVTRLVECAAAAALWHRSACNNIVGISSRNLSQCCITSRLNLAIWNNRINNTVVGHLTLLVTAFSRAPLTSRALFALWSEAAGLVFRCTPRSAYKSASGGA